MQYGTFEYDLGSFSFPGVSIEPGELIDAVAEAIRNKTSNSDLVEVNVDGLILKVEAIANTKDEISEITFMVRTIVSGVQSRAALGKPLAEPV